MVTSQELIKNFISKKPNTRVGLRDTFWPETPGLWVKQGLPTRKVSRPQPDGTTKEVDEPVDLADYFGFDMLGGCAGLDTSPLRTSEVVQETDEWSITRNGAGASFKYWKHKSGTPEHIDFRMSSREVWERDYKPALVKFDQTRIDIAASQAAISNVNKIGKYCTFDFIFVWELLRQSLGDVCMYESLALDPDWIHDFCRTYTDMFKKYLKLYFDAGAIPDGVFLFEDLGYKGKLFCSPALLEELIFPYYKEIIDFLHSYNLAVFLHSCGDVTEGMPLITKVGFDALNPMEVKAGCDIFKFAEQYGDKLLFIGGLDVRIFETNDKNLIKKKTIELVEGMKQRGAGFLFGSDHSVTPNVNFDSFKLAVDVYREHMNY
jgi:uroporphyrinogen decarboxylase